MKVWGNVSFLNCKKSAVLRSKLVEGWNGSTLGEIGAIFRSHTANFLVRLGLSMGSSVAPAIMECQHMLHPATPVNAKFSRQALLSLPPLHDRGRVNHWFSPRAPADFPKSCSLMGIVAPFVVWVAHRFCIFTFRWLPRHRRECPSSIDN